MRLKETKIIKGIIRCETGLHIGGESSTIEIGGMENPVIRHPKTNLPYIPGSSLKGKIRTLLEWELGKVEDGSVHSCNDKDCPICTIFGRGMSKKSEEKNEGITGPTRAIFRDANLTDESRKMLEDIRKEKGLLYVEEKTENVINRIRGTAKDLRTLERVPAGTEFEFEIVLRVFEGDNEENIDYIFAGLYLLQNDALGGSGSRGYGKVSFHNIKINDNEVKDLKEHYEKIKNKD
uniref:CRISPR system Cms endoribonuclease Csm3 n=1 Tax=candidate division WOR-3 bacterium TaxID=2052148 RepID=A0A7C4U6H3_UNCW3